MSQEKYIAEIQKEAEKQCYQYGIDVHGLENNKQHERGCSINGFNAGFIAGANSKAVDNRMVAFAEWLSKNCYDYDSANDGMGMGKFEIGQWIYCPDSGKRCKKTTEELLQIFKQQG